MLSTPSCVSLRSSRRDEQQRPHLGDGGADRVALLAEHVPEHGGELVGLVGDADLLGALDEGRLGIAGRGDAREVALDVGGEDRDAVAGEALGQHLQRHGLAGAGRAGDEAVAVGELEQERLRLPALADQDRAVSAIDVRLSLVETSGQGCSESASLAEACKRRSDLI